MFRTDFDPEPVFWTHQPWLASPYQFGDPAADAKSSDVFKRRRALEFLALNRSTSVTLDEWRKLSKETDIGVRKWAVAIAANKPSLVAGDVARLSKDWAPQVRRAVVEGLDSRYDRSAGPGQLRPFLHDGHPHVVRAAAMALSLKGRSAKSAGPELLAATERFRLYPDVAAALAIARCRCLGANPDRDVPALLRGAQADQPDWLRHYAILALGITGPRDDRDGFESIIGPVLQHADYRLASAGLNAIERLGPFAKRLAPNLESILMRPDRRGPPPQVAKRTASHRTNVHPAQHSTTPQRRHGAWRRVCHRRAQSLRDAHVAQGD